MKYFNTCTTLDELKKEYRRLTMLHHPDRGGDTATMQDINAEYDALFPLLKIIYNRTAETPTEETAASDRREFYTQNGWAGDRYDPSLTLKEIAQLVREFIKNHFPTYKFSVRTKYASMCRDLIVEMKEAPCKIYKDYEELTEADRDVILRKARYNHEWTLSSWNAQEERAEIERIWNLPDGYWFRVVSEQIQAAMESVDCFVNSYRYSDCDGMIDYFDVNFWYSGCLEGNARGVQYVPKTARIEQPQTTKPEKKQSFLRVEINPEFDGVEVYFPAKPNEQTRTELKAAGFRWHGQKKCWYAKNTEKNLQALRAIELRLPA